jgi:isoquinoline 1-oxidoreductase subunit beta
VSVSRELKPEAGISPVRAVIQNVSRRSVLKGMSGFVLAMHFSLDETLAFPAWEHGGQGLPSGVVADPHIFVSIAIDGTVTVVSHRAEMGTGSRTSIPMIIADEMEADWSRVKLLQAPGDEPRYGNQDTIGSRSIRHHIQPAREMGASMRYMLEQAAAAGWGVGMDEVAASSHTVIHKSLGISIGFGELAQPAMTLPTPGRDALRFKDEGELRYVGKTGTPLYDLRDITTGKARYGADVFLRGMKYAVIARPRVVGGIVRSVVEDAAKEIPGVETIVKIPGAGLGSKFRPLGGVAVVASSTWAAMQGRDALQIEWREGRFSQYFTSVYERQLRKTAEEPGTAVRNQGDAEAALAGAASVFTREYYQAHNAASPMEPPAALANFSGDGCEVWAPLQNPYGARFDIAEFLEIDPKRVTVNVTLGGSSFGRKANSDFAIEAAFLSREVGAPVRVQWTREDDIRSGDYHTTSLERIDIGLDDTRRPIAWRHRSAAPSFLSMLGQDEGKQHPDEIGMGLEDLPFDIENIRAETCVAKAQTRIGRYRAMSHIPRAFAQQSIVAELASELGRDQKEFLLEIIGPPRTLDWRSAGLEKSFWNHGESTAEYPIDTARLRNVIEIAAAKAEWGKTLPAGEGLGIAAHRSFVTYVAAVVHAHVEVDGTVRVPEAHIAVDCGYVVNPDRVLALMQGAAVFGMTAVMHSGITFETGRVEQNNFNDYPMVRADNFPEAVHVHIVEHPFSMHATGVSEAGVPPFMAALVNAIANSSGKRIRNLPIGNQLTA